MAEPKKRHSSTRSGNRRSHLAVKSISLNKCNQCKSPIIPHRVCPNCGYYKGNDVLELERKSREKEERRKTREKENEDSK